MPHTEKRVAALDVLRGFALFGILVVNVHLWFRTTPARYELALHPWSGRFDRVTDAAIELFFNLKFISLFSLLFGAGLAMQRERALARGERFVPFALRRLGMLACFGALHVLWLWMGDILLVYALLGLILLALLPLRTPTLLVCACVLMLLPLIATSIELAMSPALLQAPSPTALAQTHHEIEKSVQVYAHGSWNEIQRLRLHEYRAQLPLLAKLGVLVLAAFLLGVLGHRQHYFASPHTRRRQLQVLALTGVGLGLGVFATALLLAEEPSVDGSVFGEIMGALRPPAALLQAIAYAAALQLLFERPRWRSCLTVVFAAPGRMALTNYLGQSFVCCTLFYGWGFGLYDRLSPWQGFAMACSIYSMQVLGSRWWLKRFSQGPMEWLWRRVSYAFQKRT